MLYGAYGYGFRVCSRACVSEGPSGSIVLELCGAYGGLVGECQKQEKENRRQIAEFEEPPTQRAQGSRLFGGFGERGTNTPIFAIRKVVNLKRRQKQL